MSWEAKRVKMALPGFKLHVSVMQPQVIRCTYIDVDVVEEIVRRKHETRLRSSGGSIRHYLRSNMLLQVCTSESVRIEADMGICFQTH